jgi:biopolymer transport protein ExbD
MASIEAAGGGGGHKKGPGVKKGKKLSTTVDLTPLVDLAFLLITFFIFTTTMSTPTAMNLFLPKDTEKPEDQNKAKESGALTILLSKDRSVFYYEGLLATDGSNFKQMPFSEVRNLIMDKKSRTKAEDLVIVIKPTEYCTFADVVDALDEMTIADLKRYAMVDVSEGELALINASQGGSTGGAPAPAAQN